MSLLSFWVTDEREWIPIFYKIWLSKKNLQSWGRYIKRRFYEVRENVDASDSSPFYLLFSILMLSSSRSPAVIVCFNIYMKLWMPMFNEEYLAWILGENVGPRLLGCVLSFTCFWFFERQSQVRFESAWHKVKSDIAFTVAKGLGSTRGSADRAHLEVMAHSRRWAPFQ